jgi:phosphoribosyl-ATP pyrophosphohydrolase
MNTFINELDNIIKNRKENPIDSSYTSTLFKKGKDRILKKIGEEAGEVIIASKNNDPDELKNEAADLIFHLMITLRDSNLSFNDVIDVLEKRHRKTS